MTVQGSIHQINLNYKHDVGQSSPSPQNLPYLVMQNLQEIKKHTFATHDRLLNVQQRMFGNADPSINGPDKVSDKKTGYFIEVQELSEAIVVQCREINAILTRLEDAFGMSPSAVIPK